MFSFTHLYLTPPPHLTHLSFTHPSTPSPTPFPYLFPHLLPPTLHLPFLPFTPPLPPSTSPTSPPHPLLPLLPPPPPSPPFTPPLIHLPLDLATHKKERISFVIINPESTVSIQENDIV